MIIVIIILIVIIIIIIIIIDIIYQDYAYNNKINLRHVVLLPKISVPYTFFSTYVIL